MSDRPRGYFEPCLLPQYVHRVSPRRIVGFEFSVIRAEPCSVSGCVVQLEQSGSNLHRTRGFFCSDGLFQLLQVSQSLLDVILRIAKNLITPHAEVGYLFVYLGLKIPKLYRRWVTLLGTDIIVYNDDLSPGLEYSPAREPTSFAAFCTKSFPLSVMRFLSSVDDT